MNKIPLVIIVVLVAVVGVYFYLGGYQVAERPDAQDVPRGGGQTVVTIRNHTITVPEVTVPVGTKVTWTNEDDLAGFPYDKHTPTSGEIDPTGASGKEGVVPNSGSGISDGTFILALGSGESESFTFDTPGTYTYYIAEHPQVSGRGRVIVTEQQSSESGGAIAMEAGSFFFSPNAVEARVGQLVRVDIAATGQHTFTVDELGIDTTLPHGRTTRIEFTPDRAGVFQFYCAIPGHREGGQVGTLTVE